MGSRSSLTRPFHSGLERLGYIVVSIDYWLAPETKLPAIIEDVQDAYKWMRDRRAGLASIADRIATGGGSAAATSRR